MNSSFHVTTSDVDALLSDETNTRLNEAKRELASRRQVRSIHSTYRRPVSRAVRNYKNWVFCVTCGKRRRGSGNSNGTAWTCSANTETEYNNCAAPEEQHDRVSAILSALLDDSHADGVGSAAISAVTIDSDHEAIAAAASEYLQINDGDVRVVLEYLRATDETKLKHDYEKTAKKHRQQKRAGGSVKRKATTDSSMLPPIPEAATSNGSAGSADADTSPIGAQTSSPQKKTKTDDESPQPLQQEAAP